VIQPGGWMTRRQTLGLSSSLDLGVRSPLVTVLVVDRDDQRRDRAAVALLREGYLPLLAEDGNQAKAVIADRSKVIDLVFMDPGIPPSDIGEITEESQQRVVRDSLSGACRLHTLPAEWSTRDLL
jgi:CheY-like chemotaxis protein